MVKFYVFSSAVQQGLLWLVIIAVLNSVVSAYYYLRIIKTIWTDEPASEEPVSSSLGPRFALAFACLGIAVLGVAPAIITRFSEFGSHMFMP